LKHNLYKYKYQREKTKCRFCGTNCGGSWCPIIICESFTSPAHANCCTLFPALCTVFQVRRIAARSSHEQEM